ncbi:hypothetical protein QA612_03330 [Evansella sp. AB-P1]|uniref:hypothetical protein n=1 Tax=Evansella sp. AB-P1 TaxID=3037653 RepID=UPI00241EDAEF|nr:hypothetical protein [Evansella sp. AB-P1]MDG5786509.1 hypothetical protein [Evansella sp. AB-P1]
MKKKFSYTVSMFIFLLMVLMALPFHQDSTNRIIERQNVNQEIGGFFLTEDQKREKRFKPREYIHKQEQLQPNIIEDIEE